MTLLWHEVKTELLLYTRSRELAFFTFLLPMIFFVLLGSTYGNDTVDGVKGSRFLEAGMIGYGAISIAFAGLAIVLVIRRENGILKRLRATPLPAWVYVTALLTAFLTAFAVEVVGILLLGALLFGLPVPDQLGSLVLAQGRIVASGTPAELTGAVPATEIRYRENGREVVLETDEPTRVLHDLTARALAESRELEGLEVRRPSLEEVYLTLTEEERE